MTLNEYQLAAQRTSCVDTRQDQLTNGALGLTGEAGEVADLVKKYLYQCAPLNAEHILRELGDVLWYIAEIASALGYSLEYVAQTNIDKLESRYPDGFDPVRSNNREEGDI